MSAYSDWKVGAISAEEYRQEMAYEDRRDQYLEQKRMEEDEVEEDEVDEYGNG